LKKVFLAEGTGPSEKREAQQMEGIMATTSTPEAQTHRAFADIVAHEAKTDDIERHPTAVAVMAGITRLSLGWVFLWAFLDKTFGLGHETASKDAWIHGGSPTYGFLKFGAVGPFKDFYNSIAGQTWADWLFMLGLLGLGVALILGVFMNIATVAGTVLLVMMWSVVLPPANNVFMDDHLIYASVLVLLALLGAGRYLGFGSYWERVTKHNAWLR
jgi:thiosulfate dehydrogenase [quinone] large subunit